METDLDDTGKMLNRLSEAHDHLCSYRVRGIHMANIGRELVGMDMPSQLPQIAGCVCEDRPL